jgi:hypothetical protein
MFFIRSRAEDEVLDASAERLEVTMKKASAPAKAT